MTDYTQTKTYRSHVKRAQKLDFPEGAIANKSWFQKKYSDEKRCIYSQATCSDAYKGMSVAFKAGNSVFFKVSKYNTYRKNVDNLIEKSLAKKPIKDTPAPREDSRIDRLEGALNSLRMEMTILRERLENIEPNIRAPQEPVRREAAKRSFF